MAADEKSELLVESQSAPEPAHKELKALLHKRQIALEPFLKQGIISLEDPIEKHAAWAFTHVYSISYPAQERRDGIARYHHGIQHAARAASYVPVLANLYRRHGDAGALALTAENIKLLQIAVLFHDSARLKEGPDQWDQDSGEILFHYLHTTLKVPLDQAREMANAVAHKDHPGEPKSIYQKIIHDADCLDIIRIEPTFDARHLDFYKYIAKENVVAFEEMAELIREARSVIGSQGDGCDGKNSTIKKQYENAGAYEAILRDIKQGYVDPLNLDEKMRPEHKKILRSYPILSQLHSKLLTPEELAAINLIPEKPDIKHKPDLPLETDFSDADQVINFLSHGKIFFRGISAPSATRKKRPGIEHKKDGLETRAATEVRKTARREGSNSGTSKGDGLLKEGNPARSVTLLGFGSFTQCSAGYLIHADKLTHIQAISSCNLFSGYGKKKQFSSVAPLKADEINRHLDELIQKQKMGGSATKVDGVYGNHNEIICRIDDFQAVCYTQDPNQFNLRTSGSPPNRLPFHPYTPILEAIFLQQEYLKKHGKLLPIYEYSATHDYIVRRDFSRADIIKMWDAVCTHHMTLKCKEQEYAELASATVENIKIDSPYAKRFADPRVFSHKSLDSNYPDELRAEIDALIAKRHQEILAHIKVTVLSSIREAKSPELQLDNILTACKFDIFDEPLVADAALAYVRKFDTKTSSFSAKTISALFLFSEQFTQVELVHEYMKKIPDSSAKNLIISYYLSLKLPLHTPEIDHIITMIRKKIIVICQNKLQKGSITSYNIFSELTQIISLASRFDSLPEILPSVLEKATALYSHCTFSNIHNAHKLLVSLNNFADADSCSELEVVFAEKVLSLGKEAIASHEKYALFCDSEFFLASIEYGSITHYRESFNFILNLLKNKVASGKATPHMQEIFQKLSLFKQNTYRQELRTELEEALFSFSMLDHSAEEVYQHFTTVYLSQHLDKAHLSENIDSVLDVLFVLNTNKKSDLLLTFFKRFLEENHCQTLFENPLVLAFFKKSQAISSQQDKALEAKPEERKEYTRAEHQIKRGLFGALSYPADDPPVAPAAGIPSREIEKQQNSHVTFLT